MQAATQTYRLRIENKSKFAAGKAFNIVVMSWGFSVEMAFITIQQQQLRGLNQICHLKKIKIKMLGNTRITG